MKAEDYIKFIEVKRFDKISNSGLKTIARKFRELEKNQKLPTDLTLADVKDTIENDITVHKVEIESKSWGAVVPTEEERISPGELLYQLKKKTED